MNCCIFKGITTTSPYNTQHGVAVNLLIDDKLTISLFAGNPDIASIRRHSNVIVIAKATAVINMEYPLYECVDIAVLPINNTTLLPLLLAAKDQYAELEKLDIEKSLV